MLSVADLDAVGRQAARELVRRSFREYLAYVRIRSDDPQHVGAVPWQPWPHLVERAEAWEQGADEVILKARQEGFTWAVAAYLSWRARNGAACGAFSVGQRESRDLLRRVRYVEEHLPEYLRVSVEVTADEVRYSGSGGSIHAFPSTEQAGISYTFQVAVMDEAAFHPYGASNYAALRPTLSAGGQFIALSTADPSLGPAGFFHDLYWASKRGETGYAATFVPWYARPGRDAAWLERERRAFTGLPEEFDAYYPETDAAAFVARSGLVYPMWSELRHVKAAPCAWSDCQRRVAGVDFGGGDPTAVTVLGLTGRHHVHQYGEFYRRGAVTVEDLVGYLSRWPRLSAVVCDPSEPVAIQTLRANGIPAVAADNRRGEGLGAVAMLLEHDRLTIDPECRDSIAEFPGYRWAQRTDPHSKERYATSTPVDHHADAHDARRYAVMELLRLLRVQEPKAVAVVRKGAEVPEGASKWRRRYLEQTRANGFKMPRVR